MNAKGTRYGQTYDASKRKTFRSSLCQLLHTEFPGIFGPAVTQLFADKIDALYERFHPPRSRLHAGQVFWAAVAVDDPPNRDKRIENTRLVPVILDLVTPHDMDQAMQRGHQFAHIRHQRILRLFRQAYEQGGVLSYADVSLLVHLGINAISQVVLAEQEATGLPVPCRGTIHDMGRSITHKAIICYKRLVEKKSTSQVAEETFHSPEEVEYYVQTFRRVQLCHDSGMGLDGIAQATGHSKSLVQEYLDLIEEFQLPPLANPHDAGTVQTSPTSMPNGM
jgi:Protein of unknown function (DUF1670)